LIQSDNSGFASTATYSYQSGYGATSGFATTASYAYQSGYGITAGFATTASYLNPVTNGYVVLTQVSASLNFVDDASAAAGGVPLGGLYRNGNFILVRIS
jgi:hypothetical protein